MVYTIKIKNDKYKTFEDLCNDGLDQIKHYKGRTYPTLPKALDSIIAEWIKNVKCSTNEKIFYKNTSSLSTRRYYVERGEERKSVLKVQIQSKDNKQAKKTGTFRVLSCQEELCKILNDSLKAFQENGEPLKTAQYYRKMSKQFDIGRDRLSYVLKWINQNIGVDRFTPNEHNVEQESDLQQYTEDVDTDNSYEDISDDDDENNENQTNTDYNDTDNDHQNTTIDPLPKTPKTGNTHTVLYSSPSHTKKINRTLKDLLVWNNTAGVYKPMSPMDRKQRRRGTT
jgi:hypothetical protein